MDQFSTYAVVPKIQLLLKTLLLFFKKKRQNEQNSKKIIIIAKETKIKINKKIDKKYIICWKKYKWNKNSLLWTVRGNFVLV